MRGRIVRFIGLALPLLLALAPLPFGGRTAAASSVLCAVAGVFAVCVLLGEGSRVEIPAAGGLCALLAVAALQLVAVPPFLLAAASPAAAELRRQAGLGSLAWASLSLAPAATLAASGRLAAALAVYTGAAYLARRPGGARKIALGLCAAGAIESLYGLVVFLNGSDRFAAQRQETVGRLAGTYVNPNHFAGLIELALPATLGVIFSLQWSLQARPPERRRGWRGKLVQEISDPRRAGQRLFGILAAAMAIAVLCSRSRAGIALTAVAAGLTAGICATVVARGSRRRGLRGLGLAAAVSFTALIGLAPIAYDQLRRLEGQYRSAPTDLLAPGGRAEVWGETLRMFSDHPLLGVGLGSFSAAFPRYRSPLVSLRWEETHNDYLQLLAETGLAGALAGLFALAGGAMAARRTLGGRHTAEHIPRIGLACGCLALLVHEAFDFNLQIPATAFAFAAAAAACLVPAVPEQPRPIAPGARPRRLPWGTLLAVLAAAGAFCGAFYPVASSSRALEEGKTLMLEADDALARGDIEGFTSSLRGARAPLDLAVSANPAAAEAHWLLARWHRQAAWAGLTATSSTSSREEGNARLDLASLFDPYRPDLHLEILRERLARGQRAEALEELQVLALRGGEPLRRALPEIWSVIADPIRIGRRIDRAVQILARKDSNDPDEQARCVFVDFLLVARRDEAAESQLRGLLRSGPKDRTAAYDRLAPLLVRQGRAGEAIDTGRDLLERGGMRPIEQVRLHCSLTRAMLAAGRTEEALRCIDEALAIAPDSAGTRLIAADVYLSADRPERSAEHIEFILRGGGSSNFVVTMAIPLHSTLGRSYDLLHRRDAALREWREVARLDPANAEAGARIRALTNGL